MAIWESVLLTITGGLVAAGAGLLGTTLQVRQAARAGLAQHEREDRYRLHQERVAAYVEFAVSSGSARAAMQDLTSETDEDDDERRTARNDAQRHYLKIVLLGAAAVIVAARRMMAYADGVVFQRDPFDPDSWDDLLGSFLEAARHDLTGHTDLARAWAATHREPPPPRRRRPNHDASDPTDLSPL